MSPNTMTLDECIKWLRDRLYVTCKCDADCGEAWFRRSDGGYVCNGTHDPIPPTLDALDKARPEGWSITVFSRVNAGALIGWEGRANKTLRRPTRFIRAGDISAPTRLECEARLVVAMLVAEGEGKERATA